MKEGFESLKMVFQGAVTGGHGKGQENIDGKKIKATVNITDVTPAHEILHEWELHMEEVCTMEDVGLNGPSDLFWPCQFNYFYFSWLVIPFYI